MAVRLFKLYQRKKIININLNIILAGLAAIVISAWPVQLAVHFIQDQLGWHARWIEPVVAAAIDGVADIAIYFLLHWFANHWRPRGRLDEHDHARDESFWKQATFIQAERYLLSPIFYLVAMGGMWLLRHHTSMTVRWAFAVSFTAAILTTRVIHTVWGLRTGRFDSMPRDATPRVKGDRLLSLPADLPVPTDDGAADHLLGRSLPDLELTATVGGPIRLQTLDRAVVFCYPRTGMPDHPAGPAWDAIAGARGCTPQCCGYRDLAGRFEALGARVLGISTQTSAYQRDFAKRHGIGYPLLSDEALDLVGALSLPTFQFDIEPLGGGGPTTLIQRMSWWVEAGVIRKVWYPVFPPDQNAATVLAWLAQRWE